MTSETRRRVTAPVPPQFHAGHAIALHMVIELAKEVPLTGDAKADANVRNALARAREVQEWLEPLAMDKGFDVARQIP